MQRAITGPSHRTVSAPLYDAEARGSPQICEYLLPAGSACSFICRAIVSPSLLILPDLDAYGVRMWLTDFTRRGLARATIPVSWKQVPRSAYTVADRLATEARNAAILLLAGDAAVGLTFTCVFDAPDTVGFRVLGLGLGFKVSM